MKERILQFIRFKGISVAAFERAARLSNGYIKNFKGQFGAGKLENILLAFPELSRDWLVNGEGEMLVSNVDNDTNSKQVKRKGIPYYTAAHLEAGTPSGYGDAAVRGMEDGEILVPGIPLADDVMMLQVRGDSMINPDDPEKSIPDGSYVAVRPVRGSTIRWGELYAVSTLDGMVIKRVYPGDTEDTIKCVSYNEAGGFEPYPVKTAEINGLARAIGVVIIRQL